MKGFYSLLVGALLLFSTALSAQTPLSVTLESANAALGEQVCLDITGDDFDDVSGFQFSINYDADILDYDTQNSQVLIGQPVFIQNSAPGDVRVSWNTFGAVGIISSEPFLIGEICFTVLEEVETDVVISGTPIVIEFLNASGGNITNFETIDGVVNDGVVGNMPTCNDGVQNGNETGIDCGGPDCAPCSSCTDGIQNGNETGIDCGGPDCAACPTGNEDDLFFFMSSANAAVGSEVCLDVTTQNFEAIIGFQYTINYDPAVLEFTGSQDRVFIDLNVVQPNAFPGQIRVSWNYFNADGLGETLADNALMFTICFNVLQNTGTNVIFSGNPIGVEAFNSANESLNVVLDGGTVNGGGTSTCTDGIQNGNETGVDCGGPDCAPCMSEPTCTDGIQNGSETGIDCGGPDCAPCMTNGECGEGSSNLTLCIDNVCVEPVAGQQACMGIAATNFTAVAGFQFRVNYAAGNLDYVSSSSHPALIGGAQISPINDGQVSVLWNDPTIEFEGATIPAGEDLVEICFVTENTASTPIVLSLLSAGNPDASAIEPIDVTPGGINLPACFGGNTCNDGIQNGSETGIDCGGQDCPPCMNTASCTDGIQNGNETGIDCGGPDCTPCATMSDCTVNGSDLTVCIEEVCGEVGDQVCLDFDVTNFTAIVGLQFEVNYPAANLEYVSGTSHPNLLSPVSFNSPSDGAVTALWFDPDPNFMGQTIPAGETMINLCFTVQSTATSVVSISEESFNNPSGNVAATIFNGSVNGADCGGGNPPTCTDGIQNGNETGIDCGGPDCAPCVVMSDCTVNGTDLTVCIEEVCGEVGDQVCLDFDVTNFTAIVGLQFEVNYPAANLEYVSGTSHPNLLSPVSFNSPSDGAVTALWFDPDPNFMGQTIPAGETMINLCFTVQSTATSVVSISEESFNNPSGDVAATIFVGSVNGTGCGGGNPPTCTDGIQNGGETSVDCGGPDCAPCVSCNDGIQNGNETGVDCGGPDCTPCVVMNDCTVNGTDLTVCIEEVCGEVGDQVCLDFDVTNFTEIVGFQFEIIYPAANLEYVSGTSNANLLSPVSFNSSSDGEITALWFDPDPNFMGQTIPAGEAMINLCFTVQSTATSVVSTSEESFNNVAGDVPATIFDGSVNGAGCGGGNPPTCTDGIQNGNETGIDCGGPDCAPCVTCNDGIQNGNETGVDCGGPDCAPCETCNDGIMNGDETGIDCGGPDCLPCEQMNDCTVTGDELTICIEDVCGEVGEEVCIDFDVTNFTDIVGFEFKISYPGENLEYVNGSGTSNTALLSPVSFNSPSDGVIQALWFDPDPAFEGQTIDGTGTMVTICFTVESPLTSVISIFDDSFNDVDEVLDITVFDGSVNGSGCGMQPECNMNGVMDGQEEGIDCGGPLCPPCTTGQEDLSISVSSANVDVGDQACLDVTVESFTNMRVLDLTLNFDETAVQVSSIIATSQLPNFNSDNFTIDQANGTIDIDWTGNVGAALTDGTILFTVCFNTLTEATTNVSFDGSSSGLDGDGNQVTLLLSGGTISAVNNFENLTFIIESGSGPVGSQICLEIPTFNFTDITSFSFTINYDPLKLSFEDLIANANFPPGGNFSFTNANAGEVIVIWQYLPPDFEGITVVDGTSVAEICFDVIISCEAPVQFSESGTQILATDNNGDEVTVATVDGVVNSGIPCDGGMNAENLIIDIMDGTGLAGEEVCVDVNVTNFTSLTELSFTLNYDATILSFSGVENFGLTSIIPANFTVGPLGTITFDWDSPSSLGETIASGGSMFTLCFTVNDVVQTPINFSSMPVPIQARNGAGSNVGVIPMNGVINANAPIGDDLTLVMCCVDGEVGDIVDVDVKVFNFEGVAGFQFSTAYDPAKLQFISAGDDPALSFIFTTNTIPGQLRVSWTDPSGTGVSLPSGIVLMSFRFEILDTEAATVAFSNTPIGVEFISPQGDIIDATLINCAINGSGAPEIVELEVTPPTCHDDMDGQIELTVTGPTNLSYNWLPNPSGSTGPILENVGPGTYMVQVVNNDTGESTTESITVMAPSELIVTGTNVQNVGCTGDADGQITIAINGGIGPDYTIDWSGNLTDGVLQQLGLDEGTYGVTVTDENGCARVLSFDISEPSSLPDFNGLVTDIGDTPGSVDITVVPGSGTPDYNFSWSGPLGFTASTEDISGLTEPGLYCLVMLDANGCDRSQCFQVNASLRITDFAIVQGCFGETGSIDITVVGGDGDYTYSWTGPDSFMAETEDVSGLQPGTYVVVVTSGSESVTGSYVLETNTEITSTAVVMSATAGNNGSIDLTPTGGIPPYTYEWSNGEMTQDLEDLEAGEYCVTITDSQNCSSIGADSCFTVSAEALSVASVMTAATSCFDAVDGRVTIVMNNGSAPFTATAEPGNIEVTSTTDTIIFDLGAGTYTITIVDNFGNDVTAENVVVVAPDAITMADVSIVSDADDGVCSASITLMPAGGTGDYTYEWSVVGLEGPQVMGLCAGDYSVTLTDENGCVAEFGPFTLEQITAEAVEDDVACDGDESGSINLTVNSGVAPFSFSWSLVGSADEIATTEDLENVGAGSYEVIITDGTGATLTRTYEVGTSLGFSITTTVTSNFNGSSVTCNGASDGAARVDVSGLGTYSFEWFAGDDLIGIDSIITGLGAGTYTVVVLSEEGCENSGMVEITEPSPLVVGEEVVNVSCFNERDGIVRLEVSGGTAPYTYEWSNGGSLNQIQFLLEGDYSVVVTDNNGCSFSGTYTVDGPPELVATIESTDATDGCNGTVTVIPLSGGTGNFNYRWLQLPQQGNNPVATNLCPGDYTIEVFDENRCQTVTVVANVRDRRFPCLSERNVITPNGDGLNESFILFCTDGSEVTNNTLEIYNRWGQLVYQVADYNCSTDGGLNCFEGRTNNGEVLPAGPYYYVLDYTNPLGEVLQKRGSITIVLE